MKKPIRSKSAKKLPMNPAVARLCAQWCHNLSLLAASILCLSPAAAFFSNVFELYHFAIIESIGFAASLGLLFLALFFAAKSEPITPQ
jgi:hypothetical protein